MIAEFVLHFVMNDTPGVGTSPFSWTEALILMFLDELW